MAQGSSNVVIMIISMPYTEKRVGLSAPHIIIIELTTIHRISVTKWLKSTSIMAHLML